MKERPIDYSDKVKNFYDRTAQREWDRLFVDQSHQVEFYVTSYYLNKYLPPSTTSKVLDAGGGPGRYTVSLAREGYKMTLIDISTNELDLARTKVTENALDNTVQIAQANVTDLSEFQDNSFDAVMAVGGVISHLMSEEERKKAVSELLRVAKKDAPIFLSVMSRLGEVGNRLYRNPEDVSQIDQFLLEGNHLRPETGVFTYTHFFTPLELTDLLIEHGLEIQEMVSIQSISSPLRDHVNNLPGELFK